MKRFYKKFGKNVRKARLKIGITQEELSEKSWLHRTYISDLERGIRNISLKNIVKIAKALKVKSKDLLEF